MSAFDKVLMKIKGRSHDNGHAAANIANIASLKKAQEELKQLLQKGEK